MTNPEAIVPDSKDWTWVLTKPCAECGFDAGSIAATDVAAMVMTNAALWQEVLQHSDARERPEPGVWSPLEYACHVRDVFDLYDYRLQLMLDNDAPKFPNWNQDETALKERYDLQDPAAVWIELFLSADRLSQSFAAVEDDQWQRTGFRNRLPSCG